MKVLVAKPSGGAYLYIAEGFINAFNDVGCKASFWDGKDTSFKAFSPDLYIGCSGHRMDVPLFYKGKIAIHVNPFGIKLRPIDGVDINETQSAIEWTVKQKPDVVFGYGLDEDGKTYWKNWQSDFGIKFVGVPTAGDYTLYYPDKKSVDYKIAYLGGRWPYKAKNIDKWLSPLINKSGNKMKIYGWGGWNVEQYKGVLQSNDLGRSFLSSALVCPCICEPHTSEYGIDIPERFFKVALCESLPVIDKINGFSRYCKNYVMAESPNDYLNKCLNFACNSDFIDLGIQKAKKVRQEVLLRHTYHHRMMNLCKSLEFSEVTEKFLDKIDKFV